MFKRSQERGRFLSQLPKTLTSSIGKDKVFLETSFVSNCICNVATQTPNKGFCVNPKKILLVYPPNQLMPIETPRPDGSLGLLYLASIFEQAGFETDVLDASVGLIEGDRLEDTFYQSVMQPSGLTRIGMTSERIGEVIVNGRYAIIGINSNQDRKSTRLNSSHSSIS